jgi:hypothetical protein
MDDVGSLGTAAGVLSCLGPDALPILLAAATNLHGQHIQWEVIEDIGHFGMSLSPFSNH